MENIYSNLSKKEKINELHKLEKDVGETIKELEVFINSLNRPMVREEENKVKEIWNKIKIAKKKIKQNKKILGIK